MRFHSAAVAALIAFSLAGCNGGGSSPNPIGYNGVVPSASPTAIASGIPTTKPSGSPSASPSDSPSASPSSVPSGSPTALPSSVPATSTPAPSGTANSNQLTGSWLWGGNNTSNAPQSVQGNLPAVALTAAASGYVEITADSTGSLVISDNTCPDAFNISAFNANVDLFVNRSVLSCNFVVTDQGSGKSVKVNYSNT